MVTCVAFRSFWILKTPVEKGVINLDIKISDIKTELSLANQDKIDDF